MFSFQTDFVDPAKKSFIQNPVYQIEQYFCGIEFRKSIMTRCRLRFKVATLIRRKASE